MYAIGDLVVYGNTGVCRVTDITKKCFSGTDPDKLYYSLTPYYQNGVIYAPIDTKIFMRDVITRDELESVFDEVPAYEAKGYYCSSVQLLTSYYEQQFKSYMPLDLIKLSMSIYAKKKELESQNRKLGQIDIRFMKKAEELLFGELAIVLGIQPGEVREYLVQRFA